MYNIYLNKRILLPDSRRIRKLLLIMNPGLPRLHGSVKKQIIRTMKFTTLILITVILHVSATAVAQKVTLNEKNARLVDVFNDINAQTGYDFAFTTTTLKDTKPVTLNVRNEELSDVLTQLFQGQNLDFTIENKSVVVKPKEDSFLDNLKNKIQTALNLPVTVSGKVVDGTGQPMAGVNVHVKANGTGTTTDSKGQFSLNVPNDQTVITFSYIGYETQELRAKDITTGGVITLKAAENNLQEVVVNKGYYDEKQALSTSDISTVTAKEIAQQPVSNVLAALEGRVPGMFITQGNGAPGSGFSVQIRGQNSLTNGNAPFYVIDGVPYPSQTLETINSVLAPEINGQSTQSPLNFINPDDIESVEILKDADATSIYGSQAANGAILITTKKGKAGKTTIDLNNYEGIGQVTRMADLLNTQQYLEMRHEAYKNDGVTPAITDAPDLLLWDTTRNTNWQKLMIGNTAHYSKTQLSISGGNTNTQYLVSGAYNDQTTVFPNSFVNPGSDQTASVHFNINTSSDDKKFKFSVSGSYVSDVNTVQPTDYTFDAFHLPPDAPALFNPNGTLNWEPVAPGQFGTWTNPYATLYDTYKGVTSNLVSSGFISYALLPGLEIKTTFGYTNTQTNEVETFPTTSYDPAYDLTSGSSTFNAANTHTWQLEPQVNYRVQIGKGTLSALTGMTFQENGTNAVVTYASGSTNDALLNDAGAASSLTAGANSTIYKYIAIYGRLNYNWEDKYILNLTARRDGSSRFGPGKQFADFGSVAGAWLFSKEKWVTDNLSWLSLGKLRASYGTSGNDQIGDYRYVSLYTASSYPYQGLQALKPTNLSNPDLAWESDRKLEGGIDLGFFNNRLLVGASYYRNRSSNQLLTEPLSAVTGFPNIPVNLPALVQNTGTEFQLNTINVKSGNFSWTSSANLTIPSNKLLAFPGLSTSSYKNAFVVGQPINVIKVFKSLGVNPQTGVYQFTAADGTPTYTPVSGVDNTTLINTDPKYYGGLENSLQYKNLTLDFLFQFVKQIRQNELALVYGGGAIPGQASDQPVAALNRWQQSGDSKPYEQFSQNTSGMAYQAANYFNQSNGAYSDASFIRLKNLSLSYTVPSNWKQKLHVQNLRLYVKGQNLLTFTKYLGLDPETALALPPLRVWTAGIQLTL